MKRKSFIFYTSWGDVLAKFPTDVRYQVLDAIIEYASTGEVPEMGDLARMAFEFIRRDMDENSLKFENTVEARRKAGRRGNEIRWENHKSSQNIANIANATLATKPSQKSQTVAKIANVAEDEDEDEDEDVGSTSVAPKKENTLTSIKEKTPPQHFPYDLVAKMWNDTCGDLLPRVIKLGESRKLKIKARFAEFDKDLERQLKKYEAVLNEIADSSFCTGHNSSGWTATFDWLFDNGKNWVKVLEGNYNDDRRQRFKETKPTKATTRLGAGEYRDPTGRRTYGTGKTTIPEDAPPRPSERYSWNATTRQWIL